MPLPDRVQDRRALHEDLVARAVEQHELALRPSAPTWLRITLVETTALVAAEQDQDRQARQRRDVEPRHLLERGVGPLHARAAERRARDGR